MVLFSSQAQSQGGFKSRFVLPGAGFCMSKVIYPYNNGYLAMGFVTELVSGQSVSKLVVFGLDSVGQHIWVKKYGDLTLEYLNSFASRRCTYFSNNSIYYTGVVKDSQNNLRGVLIKFDTQGDTLWQKFYSDPNQDLIPQALNMTVDKSILITGIFENTSNNTRPCLLLKTDSLGNELWRKQINKA